MGRLIFTPCVWLTITLAVLPAIPAHADPARGPGWVLLAEGPTWQELTPQERRLLRRQRQSWSNYSPNQRQRMLNGMQQYLQMSPQQRQRLRQRVQRFNQMSPAQKRRLCTRYYQERGTLPPLCEQLK